MVDREKVIADITSVVADMQEEVDEWKDYSDSELSNGLTCDCGWWYKALQTLKDALALLKAQEPMLVRTKDTNEIIGDCPRCGRHVIHWHNKYCAECGQAVKWE